MDDRWQSVMAMIAGEARRSLPPAICAIADHVRANHESTAHAVLIYGSCLRDGDDRGRLVDIYVLVDDYAKVHPGRVMRLLNRIVPPNVYYAQTDFEGRVVRTKYALVTVSQFEQRVEASTSNPYFWARFAQPTVVAWARDEATRERVHRALACAAMTLGGEIRPLLPADVHPTTMWERAFLETYRTELRSEPPGRALTLVSQYPARYEQLGRLILDILPVPDAAKRYEAQRRWLSRRRRGKLWSVARLIKAAFTFAGGADYLAYKIERHSGVAVDLSPWQRRHPLLATPFLFWRLRSRGAFR